MEKSSERLTEWSPYKCVRLLAAWGYYLLLKHKIEWIEVLQSRTYCFSLQSTGSQFSQYSILQLYISHTWIFLQSCFWICRIGLPQLKHQNSKQCLRRSFLCLYFSRWQGENAVVRGYIKEQSWMNDMYINNDFNDFTTGVTSVLIWGRFSLGQFFKNCFLEIKKKTYCQHDLKIKTEPQALGIIFLPFFFVTESAA